MSDYALTEAELLERHPAVPPFVADIDHPLYLALVEARTALATASRQVDGLLARLDKCEHPGQVSLEVWEPLQALEVVAVHLAEAQLCEE